MIVDLVCRSCKHSYKVEASSIFKDKEKNCPECGSDFFRQTFASYKRNGPLLDPKWARPGGDRCSYFG
jgi:hypothetical protein